MRMWATAAILILCYCIPVSSAAGVKSAGDKAEAEKAAVAIESSLEKMQKTLSGTVRQTDSGLVLETEEGKYRLKGLSLEDIVGKEVHVTGVVKDAKDVQTIYVVDAGVK